MNTLEYCKDSIVYLKLEDNFELNHLYEYWKKIRTPSKGIFQGQKNFNNSEIKRKLNIKTFFNSYITK